MPTLRGGKLFQSNGRGFDRAGLQRLLEESMATGTSEFFRRVEDGGSDSKLPVFIVGMPRSGTTLVEQILANHPQVYGVGELPDIPHIGLQLGKKKPNYPVCLSLIDPPTAQGIAARHLERLARLGGPAARVVDKLPENIFHLPLIHLLFPHAAVIHCVREPLDVCLSCYFQDFYTLSFAARLEAYRFLLPDLRRLTEHWRVFCTDPCSKSVTKIWWPVRRRRAGG